MAVSEKIKSGLRRLVYRTVDLLFWLSIVIVAYVCIQVCLLASFRIPSSSMEPELMAGDYLLVFKPTVGARVFNLFASLRGERVEIHRLPGWRSIRHNDVTVFHIPYPRGGEKMEMHILKYYVKRCTGLPGDTLEIRDGFVRVRGWDAPLGNVASQRRVSTRDRASFEMAVYHTFPFDSTLAWNIRDFGPLYIPKKGDVLPMNRTHYLLYRRLIAWEQRAEVTCVDSTVYLNGQPLVSYCFRKNYYFMSGDYTEDSQDSRYWGLLPEEYIVGKAWIIWKSVDLHTGKWRRERFLKTIQ
ncbi:MAG: signal peptidase I [Tannerella sp.]|jgi:signal peptidase I|nr:signal peptidase I [Tannerella sp.]